ncbi:AAA family ATPase [Vibrio atlanticus]|uniref:5-methylcytosine-specific restriction enzyme B n=1 Tax=Vibrio atlanticus TaxID=693153 RepID=A0A1C3IV36_9VIBR|nr:AAA family ATPase [Vibrio atlanticus]SBS65283.1 5-methylcytosine-specific restriction enzyme B [Vibrio atlanticus]
MKTYEKYLQALSHAEGWVTVNEWAKLVQEYFPDLVEAAEEQAKKHAKPSSGLTQIAGRISSEFTNEGSMSQFVDIDNSSKPQKVRYKTDCKSVSELSLNQILYGPPGTGKTYHTIEAAVMAIDPSFRDGSSVDGLSTDDRRVEFKKRYDALVAQKRIRFVTFHQSYGYEEFVEGLKAKTTEEKSIEYVVENGVFKAIVEDAKSSDLRKAFDVNADATIWKISIDGTGQSEVSDYCLANGLAAIGWGEAGDLLSEDLDSSNEYYQKLGPQVKSSLFEFSQRASVGDLILCIGSQRTVQAVGVITGGYHFEQAGTSEYDHYCNQLPVNWLVTDIDVDFHELNGGVNFTQKTFYELWRFSVSDVFDLLKKQGIDVNPVNSEREVGNYVLVIDEINRGNISKIFGELITLIEPSKRMSFDKKGEDESLKIKLPHSKPLFSVPDNLYLIGTMNTADRSLAMMDTALRRRFDFVEMMPKPELLNGVVVNGIDLERLLKVINERIEILYDREHTLGHAFFMPVKNKLEDEEQKHLAFSELVSAFQNKIIPLLEEYFFEDWDKIRLVLADNQKPDDLQFVTKKSMNQSSLKALFGDKHTLDQFGEDYQQYSLKEKDNQVWKNADAYIGIYNPKSVKATQTSDVQTDSTGSESSEVNDKK